MINTIAETMLAFKSLTTSGAHSTVLLFAHPEIRPNLSHDGLPIVSSALFTQHIHDQLNNRWEFSTVADYLRSCTPAYQHVVSGGVLNMVNRVMRLTRGKLLKQPDCDDWQESEYLQLNQYFDQGMFGTPQLVDDRPLCFALSGRTSSKCWMDERKLALRVMVHPVRARLAFWMKPMPTVLTKPALVCFTGLQRPKI